MSDKQTKIMFVDDDVVTGRVMKRNCDNANFICSVYQNAQDCLGAFKKSNADIVITDLRMPGMNGFELLSELRAIDENVPVLVMTGYSSVENAVEAMKRGATDFIKKPFDFTELKLMLDRTMKGVRLKNENKLLKRRLGQKRNRFGMIGETPVMRSLFNTIEKVTGVNCNVIITGESGTGKELVARALHDYSSRKDAPFVTVDCGALNENMLESELFGHEQNAFSGAEQRQQGLLEQASGGTLFLDEICNISDAMQIKLMRTIESNKITRLGSSESINIDVRIIAASNRNLDQAVDNDELRHDFYHRLNVVNIYVPTLAERREDIPALVDQFVQEFAEYYNRDIKGYDSDSLKLLCAAPWAGNIRELRNIIEREVILSDDKALSWKGAEGVVGEEEDNLSMNFSDDNFMSLEQLEEEYINHVLRCFKGKKTKAAKTLGIDKTTLWRKLRRYDITDEVIEEEI
ncbi:MAG: sigma-54-dependent Fis family transcriptional regulator [Gammaproteobacteria bacterium]|nr:sigma-54-dependent Fis family transcriptional regulator [Gammaproteobacteria bacterium]